jgi:hypothetical protein
MKMQERFAGMRNAKGWKHKHGQQFGRQSGTELEATPGKLTRLQSGTETVGTPGKLTRSQISKLPTRDTRWEGLGGLRRNLDGLKSKAAKLEQQLQTTSDSVKRSQIQSELQLCRDQIRYNLDLGSRVSAKTLKRYQSDMAKLDREQSRLRAWQWGRSDTYKKKLQIKIDDLERQKDIRTMQFNQKLLEKQARLERYRQDNFSDSSGNTGPGRTETSGGTKSHKTKKPPQQTQKRTDVTGRRDSLDEGSSKNTGGDSHPVDTGNARPSGGKPHIRTKWSAEEKARLKALRENPPEQLSPDDLALILERNDYLNAQTRPSI